MALLRFPSRTEMAVARSCGIGRNVAAHVAASLVAKGLITRDPGHASTVIAVAPDVAVDSLIRARETAHQEARQTLPSLMAEFGRARRGSIGELVEVVSGSRAQLQRWRQLQRSARYEVRAFDAPPYGSEPPVGTDNPLEEELLTKGTSYRTLYSRAALDLPGRTEALRRLAAAGERARVMETLPMKLFIADDHLAIIPLHEDRDHPVDRALIVHRCSLLRALEALFEELWAKGMPLRFRGSEATTKGKETPDLSSAEFELLSLAVAGLTDEAMAHQLDVSRRTIERRLRRIMQRAGATSRAQLGLLAARQGWL
jgi:DNA-binding CsgD family transcriptional regulator